MDVLQSCLTAVSHLRTFKATLHEARTNGRFWGHRSTRLTTHILGAKRPTARTTEIGSCPVRQALIAARLEAAVNVRLEFVTAA
jgi:hypothetical protein